jgi:hypothetical protein
MCRSRLLLAYFNPSHTSLRSIAFDDRFGLCFTPFQIGLCYEFQNRSGDVSFCEINDRGMDYYVCYIRFFCPQRIRPTVQDSQARRVVVRTITSDG